MIEHYYNENDPFCAQWLRNLIGANLIPAGDVDERATIRQLTLTAFFLIMACMPMGVRASASAPHWGGATFMNTIGVPGVGGPSIGFRPALTSASNTDLETLLPWSYCTIKPVWPFIITLPWPTATWTPGTAANADPRSDAKRSRFGIKGMTLTIAPGVVVSRMMRLAMSVNWYGGAVCGGGLGGAIGGRVAGGVVVDGDIFAASCNVFMSRSACDTRSRIPWEVAVNSPMVRPASASFERASLISTCCFPLIPSSNTNSPMVNTALTRTPPSTSAMPSFSRHPFSFGLSRIIPAATENSAPIAPINSTQWVETGSRSPETKALANLWIASVIIGCVGLVALVVNSIRRPRGR